MDLQDTWYGGDIVIRNIRAKSLYRSWAAA